MMPFSYLDIANWARSGDFEQEMSQDSIYGFPTNLIDLANYLESGGQSGPMSGARTGVTVDQTCKNPT